MSTVKVNTVDKRTGSTLTLGGCGTTVTLGAGATQSGFGRTGTVDWCTTAKTAPFTGVSGKGYFVNTTSGAVTVTLPATPSAGDIISIADYANTWQTNSVTLCGNSSKINGVCAAANLNTQGQSVTLVYVDATRGWKNTMDSTSNITGAPDYVVATGGTITTCGNYKIHTFTADGTFTVTNAGRAAGSNKVSYLVVAGGGGSGRYYGAGGGGGGYREGKCSSDPYTASPLALTPCSALPVSIQAYPITVGAGGSTGPAVAPLYGAGYSGCNSIFSTITSAGGGGGAGGNITQYPATSGGSGGGGHNPCSASDLGSRAGGAGNTPPVSPPQGTPGVTVTSPQWAGAGGGATATGSVRTGGTGATTSINGSPTSFSGGGAGGPSGGAGPTPGVAAPSPCGTGGAYCTSACANTGGGGGSDGGSGGSGLVVIRYKYQN